MLDVEPVLDVEASLLTFVLLKNLPDGDKNAEILSMITDFEVEDGICKSLGAVLLNCGKEEAFFVRVGD